MRSHSQAVDEAVQSGKLSIEAATNLNRWLKEDEYAEFHDELNSLIDAGDWKTLEDGFFMRIEFGTGGIRGRTGVGPARINTRTIGEAAQGLADHLKDQLPDATTRGIVIGHDTRTTSRDLAESVASVLAANGFTIYLFDGFRATPEISFAIRQLKAAGGIVISASHNPPTDNGFKAMNQYGGQFVPPEDEAIMGQVRQVKEIQRMDFEAAVQSGAIKSIGEKIDRAYIDTVVGQSLSLKRSATTVYSPIHGAGQRSLLLVLQQAGFDVVTVDDQMAPDGTFPNVANHIPNPEIPSANERARDLLLETKRDLAFTSDPDADRIAVLVRQGDEAVFFNGNQSLVVAADYVCRKLKAQGKLPQNGFLSRTMVTTPMLDSIAAQYGVACEGNLIVGIKYFGDLIQRKESAGEGTHIIGGEESFGIIKAHYIQEKDAAVAALLLAEAASELREEGKTLVDQLDELYQTHGYFLEILGNLFLEGAEGMQKKTRMMESLRDDPPKTLAGLAVLSTTSRVQANDGTFILTFTLDDVHEPVVYVRPSGTEPKVKFYVSVRDRRVKNGTISLADAKRESRALAKQLDEDIQSVAKARVNA